MALSAFTVRSGCRGDLGRSALRSAAAAREEPRRGPTRAVTAFIGRKGRESADDFFGDPRKFLSKVQIAPLDAERRELVRADERGEGARRGGRALAATLGRWKAPRGVVERTSTPSMGSALHRQAIAAPRCWRSRRTAVMLRDLREATKNGRASRRLGKRRQGSRNLGWPRSRYGGALVRQPEDVDRVLAPRTREKDKRPRPQDKRVWASLAFEEFSKRRSRKPNNELGIARVGSPWSTATPPN